MVSTKSYKLNIESVDKNVEKKRIGAYVLGYINENSKFIVEYVGRSDTDINKRLKDHANEGYYQCFQFGYFPTVKKCYEKECQLYHDFGENELLDNKIHPDNPDNKIYFCPICGE